MAAALAVALATVAAGAAVSAAGYAVKRWILDPIAAAAEQAQRAERKADELEQLLVGADAEADEGMLVRLQQDIDSLKRETEKANRLQVEESYNLSELVRVVAEREEDIEVEIRDDTIYLRGDEIPDGGLQFPRPPAEAGEGGSSGAAPRADGGRF